MRKVLSVIGLILAAVQAFAEVPGSADVVVVGGSSSAVSAALAAKKAGASVYLVAPRPYLGDDLAAKLILERDGLPAEFRPAMTDPEAISGAITFGDTTPMRIKKVLDTKLLSAGIPFRTFTFATDVARDAQGRVAGVVIAGKGGRSVVRAKAVIDATEFGVLARTAGNPVEGTVPERMTFVRRVIAGEKPAAEGLTVRALGAPVTVPVDTRGEKQRNQPKEIVATLWECTFTAPVKGFSAKDFAEVEQIGRDLTWVPSTVEAADTLLFTAPIKVQNKDNVFVAGSLATELSAAKVGQTAAEAARARPAFAELSVQDATPSPAAQGCDVFVAGAGTGGAPAAISAARAGAKTIVSDYLYRMGGVMTEGLIGSYCFGIRCGFTKEMDPQVASFGSIYSIAKAEWLRQTVRQAGGEIWFGSLVLDVIKEGEAIVGVRVVMPDGETVSVPCKAAIDATGNAELALLAGEETEFINGEELSLQGVGSTPRVLGHTYQNTDSGFTDDGDAADLCYFTLRARSNFGSYVWDQSQVINSRERRRLHGVAYITAQDVMNNRTYPDVVAQTRSNFDTHGQTVSEQFFIQAPHAEQPIVVNVPYRAFLPKKADGLLVIGLGMSAHRDAMPILRMQADVQNQGYAAGYAAATAIRDGVALRSVDVKKVQRHLVAKNVIPEDALTWKDSFPLADEVLAAAVKTLPDDYKGLSQVLSDTGRSVPLLREAYAQATDPAAKLAYAHVLGLCGDATGAETLIAKLKAVKAWDKGWNYKGMDQFGRSVSWVDSYMIALGRTKDKRGLEPILRLARLLTGNHHYSHFRAVALAVESIGDPSAAPVLADLLAEKDVGGHVIDSPVKLPRIPKYDTYSRRNLGVADKERSDCLRELCLARALFRCGDKDGLGKRVLEAYAADPRRAYAKHAELVLKGAK